MVGYIFSEVIDEKMILTKYGEIVKNEIKHYRKQGKMIILKIIC